MSFHTDPETHQVVIHCDVCGKPIQNRRDGHVNWNKDGPFTFNHYGCGGPEVFSSDHYEYNTAIPSWIASLGIGCPLPADEQPTDPLSVSLEEWLNEKTTEWKDAKYNAEQLAKFQREQAEYQAKWKREAAAVPGASEEWNVMTAEELCNTDLSKNEAEEL
jgi:hypothetical protein